MESQKKLIEKLLEEREDSLELHNLVASQSQQIQNFAREKQEMQKLLFNKTVELDEKMKKLAETERRFEAWSKLNSLDKLQEQERTISELQTIISGNASSANLRHLPCS